MTPNELRDLSAEEAAKLAPLLEALWYLAHNDWSRAHLIAQEVETPQGSWLHAHLHRAEGDAFNASYWYRRAARPVFNGSLADEWQQLAAAFLQR